MGLFDKLGTPVEDIPTSYEIKDGGYQFQIEDMTVKVFDDDHATMPGQTAIMVKLMIIDGDNETEIGKTFTDFLRIPDPDLQGKTAAFYASNLKAHLLQFGVPEGVLEDFDPEDEDHKALIVGAVGTGSLKTNNKGFQNLSSFERDDDTSELVTTSASADGDPSDKLAGSDDW